MVYEFLFIIYKTERMRRILNVPALLVGLAGSHLNAFAQAVVITDFTNPPAFSYLSFENIPKVENGIVHIAAPNGQGGAGWQWSKDMNAHADHSPVLWAKTGPRNQAQSIKVFFAYGDTKRMFSYSLKDVGQNNFVKLLPEHSLALGPAAAAEPDQAFDPAKIQVFQVQGNWKVDPIDVYLDQMELMPPAAAMIAQRQEHTRQLKKMAERKQREAEMRQQEIERLLTGATHPKDGPKGIHIGAATLNTNAHAPCIQPMDSKFMNWG
jgi:hypothetical protein